MPDHHPPRPDGPSAPLRAELERDFGSVDDFLRALDAMSRDPHHGGSVCLVCTPDGRLRLVHTPPGRRPRGLVLFCTDAHGAPPPPPPPPPPPWRELSDRYEGHIHHRPPYPMP